MTLNLCDSFLVYRDFRAQFDDFVFFLFSFGDIFGNSFIQRDLLVLESILKVTDLPCTFTCKLDELLQSLEALLVGIINNIDRLHMIPQLIYLCQQSFFLAFHEPCLSHDLVIFFDPPIFVFFIQID